MSICVPLCWFPSTLIWASFCSPNDLRFGKMSSSIESDRGSLLNVMNVFDRQEELVSTISSPSAPNITLTTFMFLVPRLPMLRCEPHRYARPCRPFRGMPCRSCRPKQSPEYPPKPCSQRLFFCIVLPGQHASSCCSNLHSRFIRPRRYGARYGEHERSVVGILISPRHSHIDAFDCLPIYASSIFTL